MPVARRSDCEKRCLLMLMLMLMLMLIDCSGRRRVEEDDDLAADGEVHSSSFHGFLDANMLQHVFQLLTLPVSSEKYLQLGRVTCLYAMHS